MPSLSVVIPTLQRSDDLDALVQACSNHDQVLEVIIINNSPSPLSHDSPKVVVLQQEGNIFVNPAWNLGYQHARGEFLAIINDDVAFDTILFDKLPVWLSRPWVGIVGAGRRCDDAAFVGPPRIRLATYDDIKYGFGVMMAMRRKNYTPIPIGPKIWGGDDWLFQSQRSPNWVVRGVGLRTEMGTSSASAEFQQLRSQEINATRDILCTHGKSRWWNRVTSRLTTMARARGLIGDVG